MSFRYRHRALRRAALAALVGASVVAVWGPLLTMPALALVALVYYGHQLAAVLAGDESVPYPSLAFVIVVNAGIVLLVQVILVVEGFSVRG
jgi:hypothetical protein